MNTKGFTLVETVLYIAITVAVLLVLVETSFQLLSNFQREKYISSVQSELLGAAEKIRSEIRQARSINTGSASTTFDSDSGSISLESIRSSLDPTVISLINDNGQNRLGISYNSQSYDFITSQRVQVDRFYISNYSSANEKTENVQFVLKFSIYRPTDDYRLPVFSSTVTSSVELIGI